MATATTPREDLKAYERDFVKTVWNGGDYEYIDEMIDEEYVGHWFTMEDPTDREGLKSFIEMVHDGFSDFEMEIEFLIAEDDLAIVGFTTTGTHDGEFMGIPATGKTGSVPGFMAHRIEDGKAVEGWAVWDALGLLQQVGAVPESFTLSEFLETTLNLTRQGITRRTRREA